MSARFAGLNLHEMLLAEQVSEALHIAPSTVHEWARRNRLPHVRLAHARRVLFPAEWIRAYLAGDTALDVVRGPDGGRVVRPRSCTPKKRG